MASVIEKYKEQKDSVISLLRTTISTYNDVLPKEEAPAFEELIKKAENGRFSIIVVGEFSAGKSTFLNALMGEKYLDSFSSETTANINYLRSIKDSPSGKPMIRVNYVDGSVITSDDVSFENIQKYVSTKGEKDVASKISSVEIFLDSQFLNDGVDLIDSPGLNGIKPLHADITKNQIKESHAAIFMFRATQPGSKTDFDTLSNLKKNCKSIFIVLNRIDEAVKEGEETVDDIVNKLKDNYKSLFPSDSMPEIHPLSAFQALVARSKMEFDYHGRSNHTEEEKKKYLESSLIQKFEERLLKFITQGEKAKAELLSPVEKVCETTDRIINKLADDRKVIEQNVSATDIEEKRVALQNEIKEVKKTIEDSRNEVFNAVDDAIRNAKNAIKGEFRDLREREMKSLESEASMDAISKSAESYFAGIMGKYQSIFTDAADKLQNEFKQAIKVHALSATALINQKLSANEDEELKLTAVQLDTKKFDIDLDLSKYDNQIASLEEKRNAIKEELWDAVEKEAALKAKHEMIQEEIRCLDQKEQKMEENYQIQMASFGNRPDIERREKINYEKRFVLNPKRIFGDKYDTTTEVIFDDSAQRSYDEQKRSLQRRFNDNSEKIREQRDELVKQLRATSSIGQQSSVRAQMELEDLNKKLQKLESEKQAEMNKLISAHAREAKVYLTTMFDNLKDNGQKQALKTLESKREQIQQIAIEILELEIKDELEAKVNLLNKLEETANMAMKDKEEKLKKNEAATEALSTLLLDATSLRNQLESIETDTIKES